MYTIQAIYDDLMNSSSFLVRQMTWCGIEDKRIITCAKRVLKFRQLVMEREYALQEMIGQVCLN